MGRGDGLSKAIRRAMRREMAAKIKLGFSAFTESTTVSVSTYDVSCPTVCAQGTDLNQRLGDNVKPKFVDVNIQVYPAVFPAVGALVRVVAVWVKSTLGTSSTLPVGVLPAPEAIFAFSTPGTQTPVNSLYCEKGPRQLYRILHDSCKVLGRVDTAATMSYGQGENTVYFKLHLPLNGVTTYSNTGNAIADTSGGHVFVYTFVDSSTNCTCYKEVAFTYEN